MIVPDSHKTLQIKEKNKKMSNKLVKKQRFEKPIYQSSHRSIEEKILREKLINDTIKKMDNARTRAFYLSFGAAMIEELGIDLDTLMRVFKSADDKMGKYNTMNSLQEFEDYIADTYDFGIGLDDV